MQQGRAAAGWSLVPGDLDIIQCPKYHNNPALQPASSLHYLQGTETSLSSCPEGSAERTAGTNYRCLISYVPTISLLTVDPAHNALLVLPRVISDSGRRW